MPDDLLYGSQESQAKAAAAAAPADDASDDGYEDEPSNPTAEARYYNIFYDNYLLHYSLYGRGRPKLSRLRYEQIDKELLSLVDRMQRQAEAGSEEFTREMFNRVRELEYLLMDDIAESLLDTRDVKSARLKIESDSPKSLTEPSTKLAFRWSDDSRGLAP